MPTYRVKPDSNYPKASGENTSKPKKTWPTVSIPVNPEIIAALEVGKPVTVELQGIVRGLESRQSVDSDPWANRNELRVELRTVEAYAGEDDEEDAAEGEADDESESEGMRSAIDKALGYGKKKE